MSEKFSFDDFMLRRAMKQIMDDEVAALPSDIELADSISVSDEFREKMSILTKQSRRRLTLVRTMKAVAAIFIGAVLIFSVEQMMENGVLFGGDGATGTANGPDDPSMYQTDGAEPADAAPVEGAKTDSFEEDEEYEYINYTYVKNDIDDIMVDRINEAGNHNTETALCLNEDIYYLAWRSEYYRLTDHLGNKRMKEYPHPQFESDSDRSKYNLTQAKKYREQCILLLESMDTSDDYKIYFDEFYYDALRTRVKDTGDVGDKPYYGVWLVKKVTGSGYVMHTTEEQDKEYLGSIIVLNKNSLYEYFTNAGEYFQNLWGTDGLLENPKYKEKKIDDSDLINMARIPLKNLGIKKKKTKMVTVELDKNDDYPFTSFIVRDKNHLIISGESFYLAERLDVWPSGAETE